MSVDEDRENEMSVYAAKDEAATAVLRIVSLGDFDFEHKVCTLCLKVELMHESKAIKTENVDQSVLSFHF